MLVALHNLLGKERTARYGILTVAETVTLLIGFSYDIESVLVAKVVPDRVIGIVTGTHSVDIQLLHQLYVLNHTLTCHHITTIRVHLMTVSSLEENRLAIDQHLCILDFNLAETNLERDSLDSLARLGILHMNIEIIEVRSLSRPLLWVSEYHNSLCLSFLIRCNNILGSKIIIRIFQHQESLCVTSQLKVDAERTALVVIYEIRSNTNIFQVLLCIASIEIAIASNTTEPPEVLILTIAAI